MGLRLRFYDTPKLKEVVLADAVLPAIILSYSEQVPATLAIHGKVETASISWGNLGFSLSAYKEKDKAKTPWQGLELVSTHNFATFQRQNYLAVATGDLSAHLANQSLTLEAGNTWAVMATQNLPEIICEGDGDIFLQNLQGTHALRFMRTQVNVFIEDAPDLEVVAGDGRRIGLNLNNSNKKTFKLLGGWGYARLRAKQIEKLVAPKVHTMMIMDAPALVDVDLSHGAEISCHGAVPAPLSETAQFYFHESTVKNILERLFSGEVEMLPSLLNILPHASDSRQVRHSLNALWRLCEVFTDPQQIWKARCQLLSNNSNRTHIKPDPEEMLISTKWDWRFPDDLYIEGWLTDLKIWDYCQKSVPEARSAKAFMEKDYIPNQAALALPKVFASSASLAQKKLVAQKLKNYLSEACKITNVTDDLRKSDPARRIAYEIKNTPDSELQKTLIYVICNLLDKNEFLTHIPPIIHLAPEVFRPILLELSHTGPNWSGCKVGRYVSAETERVIAEAKQILLMMALAPFKQPTSSLQTA